MIEQFWPFEHFYRTTLKISKEESDQVKIFMHNFKHSVDPTQVTTYQKLNILSLPALKNLRSQIVEVLNFLNLNLDDNWAQLYKENNFHVPHTHYGSEYSGVIYIEGNSPNGTSFLNPKGDVYTSEFKVNDLILFPSYILHFVNVQQEDNNRIIISFNTKKGGNHG